MHINGGNGLQTGTHKDMIYCGLFEVVYMKVVVQLAGLKGKHVFHNFRQLVLSRITVVLPHLSHNSNSTTAKKPF